MLLRPEAAFPLALELRSTQGAKLGDVFSFVSGLYFRGKARYAERFGALPHGRTGGFVISPADGLMFLDQRVTTQTLTRWAKEPIDLRNLRYTEPLMGHCHELLRVVGENARYVLLGSVATDKYVQPLTQVLGERLMFPSSFAGLGDMSRGALLLRAVRDSQELPYVPVLASQRTFARSAKKSAKQPNTDLPPRSDDPKSAPESGDKIP